MGFQIKDSLDKIYNISSLSFATMNDLGVLDKKYLVRNIYALNEDLVKTNIFSSIVLELWFYRNQTYTIPTGYRSMDIFCVGGGQSARNIEGWKHYDGYWMHNGAWMVRGGNGGETTTKKIVECNSGDILSITIGTGGAAIGNITTSNIERANNGNPSIVYLNGIEISRARGGMDGVGSAGAIVNGYYVAGTRVQRGKTPALMDGFYTVPWKSRESASKMTVGFVPVKNYFSGHLNGFTNGAQARADVYGIGGQTYFGEDGYGNLMCTWSNSQNRTTALFSDESTGIYFSAGGYAEGNKGNNYRNAPSGTANTGNGGNIWASDYLTTPDSGGYCYGSAGGSGIVVIRLFSGKNRPSKENMKIKKIELR